MHILYGKEDISYHQSCIYYYNSIYHIQNQPILHAIRKLKLNRGPEPPISFQSFSVVHDFA